MEGLEGVSVSLDCLEKANVIPKFYLSIDIRRGSIRVASKDQVANSFSCGSTLSERFENLVSRRRNHYCNTAMLMEERLTRFFLPSQVAMYL